MTTTNSRTKPKMSSKVILSNFFRGDICVYYLSCFCIKYGFLKRTLVKMSESPRHFGLTSPRVYTRRWNIVKREKKLVDAIGNEFAKLI